MNSQARNTQEELRIGIRNLGCMPAPLTPTDQVSPTAELLNVPPHCKLCEHSWVEESCYLHLGSLQHQIEGLSSQSTRLSGLTCDCRAAASRGPCSQDSLPLTDAFSSVPHLAKLSRGHLASTAAWTQESSAGPWHMPRSSTPTPAQDALLHPQPHQQPLEDVLIFVSMLQPRCFSVQQHLNASLI